MNEQDFIAAIVDAPDDDTPRLIYADWLDEKGDLRGEFIRVQCERESLDDRDPRCLELEYRERNLLAQYRNLWAKPVRKWGRVIGYRRGFVEDITVQAGKFLESGEELLSLTPIRRLKLMKAKLYLPTLADCPLLERLETLNLRDSNLGLARLEAFLKSHWLSQLRGFDFGFNGWGPSALREFVTCKTIGSLDHLALSGSKIESTGLQVLLDSGLFRSLETLQLGSNSLTNDDTRTLAESSQLGSLRSLDVEQNDEITSDGLFQLLSADSLASLRNLSIRNCGAGQGNDIEQAFPMDSPLKNLIRLNLEGLFIRQFAVAQLAKASWLEGLVHLNLGENYAEPSVFEPLFQPGRLPRLRTLDLSVNKLKNRIVERLIEMGTDNLTELHLHGNNIGNKGAKLLAQAGNFANLNILNLRQCGISDPGARELAKSDSLDRLTELRLTATSSDYTWNKSAGISDDVKQQLLKRFGKHVCHFD